MVLFNYSTKELTAKVVYYGPGLCGKTTNLQYIHGNLPETVKGKMLSLATKTDRTLFFDFLPLDLGTIRGMKTRIQLYTVPGQVFYNETRKLVLKGADGIVFVADSQEQMMGANVESFKNLEENLKAHGMDLAELPHVIQFNKRDLPKLAGIEALNASLNKFNAPFYESVATTGIGVQDTLKAITKLVLLNLTQKYDPKAKPARAKPAAPQPQVQAPKPAAVQPPTGPGLSIPLSTPPSDEVEAPPPAPLAAAPVPPALETEEVPLSGSPEQETPLVEAGREGPPPPPDFNAPPVEEEAPAFGETDIDDLVSEVEESEEPEPVIDDASSTIQMPLPDIEDETVPEDVTEPAAAPVAEPEVEQVPLAAAPEEGAQEQEGPFEIDRGFDPEWSEEGGAPAFEEPGDLSAGEGLQAVQPEPADELPIPVAPEIVEESEPVPLDEPSDSEPVLVAAESPEPEAAEEPPAEQPVVLTEVEESDQSLFSDPSLEVTRLATGEAQEIVVPVEVGEGEDRRRFKLSVTLRLDPVE